METSFVGCIQSNFLELLFFAKQHDTIQLHQLLESKPVRLPLTYQQSTATSLITSVKAPAAAMAALLILAGAMIHDRYKERKDSKRRKAIEDERKHAQLQAAVERRAKRAGVERNYESEDEQDDEPLPRYEDVIRNDGVLDAGTSDYRHFDGECSSGRSAELRRHSGIDRTADTMRV